MVCSLSVLAACGGESTPDDVVASASSSSGAGGSASGGGGSIGCLDAADGGLGEGGGGGALACTATSYPFGSCAGWRPVFANADENELDSLDPAAVGGDPFDLADVGVAMARFVRITDRPDRPDVFDLDAVGIVNALCP